MDNEPNDDQNAAETWESEAERFIESAGADLGDLYAPQIRAFRHYARQLDAAGDDASAVLVAEYSRTHRWLLNKIGRGGASPSEDDEPNLLDMFRGNPGVMFRAD